jgi:hypothetical protein
MGVINNKQIWIPFKKIMIEFDLECYQPLLSLHTLAPNKYDLGHRNSILPFVKNYERIK